MSRMLRPVLPLHDIVGRSRKDRWFMCNGFVVRREQALARIAASGRPLS